MSLPFVLDPTGAALAMGVAAALLTVLYLLRERYRPVLVSHLPLWEQSVKRSTPLALARRLRKVASLLLQMVIVALAVMALTDPQYPHERSEPRSAVLLVDVSPSMRADDGAEGVTRIAQARRFARQVVRSLDTRDAAMLAALSSTPLVARSWGRPDGALVDAIGALSTRTGRADVEAGLELAAAALADRHGGEVWIVSDGAFGLEQESRERVARRIERLEERGVAVRHHRCGEKARNVAITHFAMRQDLRDRMRVLGMLEAARFGEGEDGRTVAGRVEVRAGDHPVLTRRVEVDGDGERIWLDLLSPPSRHLTATLTPDDPGRDHLDADNSASVTLPEETELSVLAVSEGNTFLKAALLLSPTWNVEWIAPGKPPGAERYDVLILDGDVPRPEVDARGILAIHPTGGDVPVETAGEMESPSFETFDREHPIIRWTNLYNVNMSSALVLETEKGDRVLGGAQRGPLILLREPEEGPALLVLAFDLAASDLPMRAAWPLLFLNAVHYLGGESLEVSASGVSPKESRIRPAWLRGARHVGRPPGEHPAQPPLWLVLAACAALLFALEWVTYHRRITV